MLQFQGQLELAQNYLIEPFVRFSIPITSFKMEVRMIHPLKGEPLTVLVMPNIIVSEHVFDVNDLGYYYVLYCILF